MIAELRKAIHEAITDNPQHLKAEAVAARMGVNVSTLYRWGEPDGAPIPMERLVQLCLITQDSRPVAVLARATENALIPTGRGAKPRRLEDCNVRAIKEFADFVGKSSEAFLDGRVTASEFAWIEREGRQAMLAIACVIEAARAKAGGAHG